MVKVRILHPTLPSLGLWCPEKLRRKYVGKIKLFREEGKDVIYLDDTWANVARSS